MVSITHRGSRGCSAAFGACRSWWVYPGRRSFVAGPWAGLFVSLWPAATAVDEKARSLLGFFAEEETEVFEGEGAGEGFFAEDVVGEGAFLVLQVADLFLDAVLHYEAVGF